MYPVIIARPQVTAQTVTVALVALLVAAFAVTLTGVVSAMIPVTIAGGLFSVAIAVILGVRGYAADLAGK